jgi:predicted glycosyltransferase
MRIPEKIVDGLNLIWHSDLVISAGGTMNREAAALGVPVYSIFRGEIGAVDRYLTKTGRLVLIESGEDLSTKILPVRRERLVKPTRRHTAALSYIVERIASIAESQRPFSDRIEVIAEVKSSGEVRRQDATV